jgi:N-acetylglucosamine kinase-like BadF-type ATPase
MLVTVDGGKSATRVRIADQRNVEVWRGQGPGFHYSFEESIAEAVLRGVSQAVAGTTAEAPAGPGTQVCAALTGLPGDAQERGRLRDGLARLFDAEVSLVDDVLAAHAGALAGPGTVVSAGTGTKVLAIGPDGAQASVDGWGPLIGDRGSAHAIGRAALRAAAAARDGTGPTTSLTSPVFESLGGSDLAALQRFYRDREQTARVAGLAPLVVGEADRGDEVARAICRAAAHDLAASVVAAATAAFGDPAGSTASWSGRLLTLGRSLVEPFEQQLQQGGIQLCEPDDDGLVGAARLLVGGTATFYAPAVQTFEGQD